MIFQEAYPDDIVNRNENRFDYRFRGGESYRDVVIWLEPIIMELECQENILIIGHQVRAILNILDLDAQQNIVRLFCVVCKLALQ